MQRPSHLVWPLLFGLLGACGETAPEASARNVLLIVVDTLRADHVGAYGYGEATTPVLDELATRSLVFETAYAQSPWTKPSVASIFTSLHATQHRVLEEDVTNRLGDDLTTLAETLAAAGWRTGAFVENPHIVAATGFDQGFEVFDGPLDWLSDDWEADCEATVEAAIRWLRGVPAEDPWFLYLHLLDPHDPYDGGLSDPAVTPGAELSASVRAGRVLDLLEADRADRPRLVPTAQEIEQLVQLYDAEIRRVDRALGDLLAFLRAAGRELDTVLLVTADHGEEFHEHGRFRHGYHLYEETLRVPLLVRVPGQSPGRRSDVPVQHVDIAPTLLAQVGLPAPDSFSGKNFLHPDASQELAGGPVVSETAMRGLWRRSLRLGRWKLIRDELGGQSELYDLQVDPGELEDLAGTRGEVTRDLELLLGELERPTALSRPPDSIDPEILRALERLGYATGKDLPR